ncbi:MAG TPA: hypothetical protein PKN36_06865 [bacterium]|nr:hypothetical protein [bacterium]
MRNKLIALLVFAVSQLVYSQDIKIPEEKITGEDLRIEKSEIFIRQHSIHDIRFPSVPMLPEKSSSENGTEISPDSVETKLPDYTLFEEGRRHVGFSAGSNTSAVLEIFCPVIGKDTGSLYDLEISAGSGYRHNDETAGISFGYLFESRANKFSAGMDTGYLQLPGPDNNPFDLNRNYFLINTSYSHSWPSGVSAQLGQSFRNIDGTETNYSSAGLFYSISGISFNTGIERYDVLGEGFSETSFSQAAFKEGRNFKLGGAVKKIEGHDVKFLPLLEFVPVPGLSVDIEGFYRTPDLWKELVSCNYKEIREFALAPEEEYRLGLSWGMEKETFGFSLKIAHGYIENSYTWADFDANGLYEPVASNYRKTAVNLNLNRSLFGNLSFFIDAEREFPDKDIFFYPEEQYDAGFVWKRSPLAFKIWASHKGDRIFPGTKLEAVTLFNAELKSLNNEKMEWIAGISNIGGKKYPLVPGYPAEERKIYVTVKFYF